MTVVRPVAAADTWPLRQLILRPGLPLAESIFEGDDDPDAHHFGAFDAEDRLVGVASLYRHDGHRLRGMAVAPGWQGSGVGTALLGPCRDVVAERGGGRLWCNARISAVGFYARNGFAVVGDEFDIRGIGPHVVMSQHVAGGSPRPAG